MKNWNKETISTGIAHNSLAAGTTVKGEINAEEDIRIDGKVEGNIECSGKVVVGPLAEITGDIRCQNTDLMGLVTGNITIYETACLKSTVRFTGDIETKYIEIEAGAVFNGTCKMTN
ncbi:MAG: polymer-forming cytoskeletal protein [Dysgonamonadaceae bacterium]|jgi:cytoskeletal protein CcmA (bactofilin family)|nr:polymer-forming cytoskeletal protein [Dysgonamonadaceae bacterium]